MGTKTTGKFCNHCNAQVMAQGRTPNHILHLLLSLVTFGAWIVVWIILTLASAGGYRCTKCGNPV